MGCASRSSTRKRTFPDEAFGGDGTGRDGTENRRVSDIKKWSVKKPLFTRGTKRKPFDGVFWGREEMETHVR